MTNRMDREGPTSVMRHLEREGVALMTAIINEKSLARLLALLDREGTDQVRRRSGAVYGVRNLLRDVPELREALVESELNQLASDALGEIAFPVDAIYFDKHPEANWGVPGHQDVLMPILPVGEPDVRHRGRVRDGVTYLEASDETLASLVALRLHFDDCDAGNGALCVIPGSHLSGRLREAEIASLPLDRYVPCPAARGDVLLMKPLTVHRSAPSQRPAHRRVLHVVYATAEPGEGLRWRDWAEDPH